MAGMASNGDAADPTPRIQYRPLVAAPELQQDWHDEQVKPIYMYANAK